MFSWLERQLHGTLGLVVLFTIVLKLDAHSHKSSSCPNLINRGCAVHCGKLNYPYVDCSVQYLKLRKRIVDCDCMQGDGVEAQPMGLRPRPRSRSLNYFEREEDGDEMGSPIEYERIYSTGQHEDMDFDLRARSGKGKKGGKKKKGGKRKRKIQFCDCDKSDFHHCNNFCRLGHNPLTICGVECQYGDLHFCHCRNFKF